MLEAMKYGVSIENLMRRATTLVGEVSWVAAKTHTLAIQQQMSGHHEDPISVLRSVKEYLEDYMDMTTGVLRKEIVQFCQDVDEITSPEYVR